MLYNVNSRLKKINNTNIQIIYVYDKINKKYQHRYNCNINKIYNLKNQIIYRERKYEKLSF